MFLIILSSCFSDNDAITSSKSDDYIVNFTYIEGRDVYEKGQSIGEDFYIYQNGTIISFEIIYEENSEYQKSWNNESNKIDSLHSKFEKTGFTEFPEHFPGPPIIGPAPRVTISYRKNTQSAFTKIYVFLLQEESQYPDGFLELYSFLDSICFKE